MCIHTYIHACAHTHTQSQLSETSGNAFSYLPERKIFLSVRHNNAVFVIMNCKGIICSEYSNIFLYWDFI